MTTRWEIPEDDWDSIKEKVADRLRRAAQAKTTITYTDTAAGLPFSGPDSHALAEMLGEIGAECAARGEPLLTALAVYKDIGEPGPGFYRAAQHLGLLPKTASATQKIDFWAQQVKECVA